MPRLRVVRRARIAALCLLGGSLAIAVSAAEPTLPASPKTASPMAPSPLAPSASRPQPLSPVALVDAYMAAWNAHDAAKAASYMDDKVTYYDASTPAPQIGKAAAQKNVIEAFLEAAPDCVWKREGQPIAGSGGVAFQWVFSGTNTGDWGDGTKATGKKFEFRGATIMRLRNYRILYQGDYYDAYGFFKQLGLAQ